MYLLSELNIFSLLFLLFLWWLSGDLILQKYFPNKEEDRIPLAFGLGLILNTFSVNILGRVLSSGTLFWSSAVLWVIIAFALHIKNIRDIKLPTKKSIPPLLITAAMAILFTLIGRGFGFFDDHQNLPPVSMMATGVIPPRFAFDPSLMFGYHYFLLLVSSTFVQTASAYPWTALDLARGIALTLTLMYGGILAYRMTSSRVAQFFSMVFIAFAGGARWIMLLIPATWLNQISTSVKLIGSGADSAPNLRLALFKNWNIEGTGEIGLPFMYGSGLDPSFSMLHNGWGTSAIMIVLLLLLLTRGKKITWPQAPFLIIPLASLALANEVTFVFLYIGLVLALAIRIIQERSLKNMFHDQMVQKIFVVFFAAGLISLFQGGMLTEIFYGLFKTPAPDNKDTYFKVGFSLVQPTFLSAHLGYLRLLKVKHWIPILAETGLAVFALPITVWHTRQAIKNDQWIKAAWILSIFASLAMMFFEYTGNAGPTAISRMQAHFLSVIKILAVPLVWNWAKQRSENIQVTALSVGALTIFSGAAMFGVQLTAAPKPVSAIFLGEQDTVMYQKYWNTLDTNTMLFDPVYPRGVTIFGLPTRSNITMGLNTPEWKAFKAAPDPISLSKAGYGYLYADLSYYQEYKALLTNPCVTQIEKIPENANPENGRILLNLSNCTK